MVKLNTNGTKIIDNMVGCSEVIRDNRGAWIKGFSTNRSLCSALLAEF